MPDDDTTPDDAIDTPPDVPDADDEGTDGADALGDKGKQALDRMKQTVKDTRAELAGWKALGMTPDEARALVAASRKPEDGPDEAAIRRDADIAATAKANDRIVRSEIRAAAAGKLADPKDALVHIDLAQFEVDADGNIDEDEVADAIADLLTKKPYLGVQDAKRFQGAGDGGARKETQVPIEQQIAEATKAGNHSLAIALKRQAAATT